jgi:hypothetical protein
MPRSMPGPPTQLLPSARAFALALALALAGVAALGGTSAHAAMKSEKLSKNLCKTTGGGKFVRAKGTGGIKIDRRLVRDIRWMKRKYDLKFGDGYAMSGHSMNGEHPIGLAADIYAGSSWNKVDKLAELAEPRQDRPRLPWRWVGYDGDAGHGRGHHLHLSWGHNDRTTPGEPAKWVLTRHCPRGAGDSDGGGGDDGGGISSRDTALRNLADPVPEEHEHDHHH